jgi:nitroreductase
MVMEEEIQFARAAGQPAANPVEDVMARRFACRAFLPTPVARETVEAILLAAAHAPSGANIQPWKAYVVSGPAKDAISAEILRAHESERDAHASEYKYYSDSLPEPFLSRRKQFGEIFYGALGIAYADTEGRLRQTGKNYGFFGAPVGIFFTIARDLEIGSWLDLVMFVQNVMLSAKSRGLDTCAQETFSKYHGIVRRHLPIGPSEILVCGMSLGVGDEAANATRGVQGRARLDEIADFSGFRTPQRNS